MTVYLTLEGASRLFGDPSLAHLACQAGSPVAGHYNVVIEINTKLLVGHFVPVGHFTADKPDGPLVEAAASTYRSRYL